MAASSSINAEALLATRPPETDRFTYLTLIEQHLSPELLPTLHTVLQDASLTQELGWDLVDMLVPLLPASETCLDDVARLGNPREVILKVLEVLERLRPGRRPARGGGGGGGGLRTEDENDDVEEEEKDNDYDDYDEDGPQDTAGTQEDETATQAFVALLGMLAILHRRLKTKYPSRFLETSLRTILAAYRPDRPAMTTAVLGLVRSLAARRRPAPPIRRSDSELGGLVKKAEAASMSEDATATASDESPVNNHASAIGMVGTDHARPEDDDTTVSVPDPEAEDQVAPAEGAVQQRLLQAFVTCIIEAYVNANSLVWAPRLVEYYRPQRQVPGRLTELLDFREDPAKIALDTAVSQFFAIALDLGLTYSDALVQSVCTGPVRRNPFGGADQDLASAGVEHIPLATGGVICLLAFWVFASDVFKSDARVPNLRVFPDHYAMLRTFFDDNAAAQIAHMPGTVDALVAIGLWLDHHGLYTGERGTTTATPDNFMPYHHLLTLCAVFHPSLPVRNAATTLAGAVLHANPDAEDRLKILQDLLENCMFASLKACAVTWLREEILAATAATAANTGPPSLFGTADAVEQLQYAIFPDLQALRDATLAAQAVQAGSEEDEETALLDYWLQNAPFLLQSANFAYLLFCSDRLRAAVVPPGMGPAIEQRYVEPLLQAASRLRKLLGEEEAEKDGEGDGHNHGNHGTPRQSTLDLDVLSNRLESIKLS